MFCSACGFGLDAEAVFCSRCGAKVIRDPRPSGALSRAEKQERARERRESIARAREYVIHSQTLANAPSPFNDTMSINLEALGIPPAWKVWSTIGAVVLLLIALGAAGAYAMRAFDEPAEAVGTAEPDAPVTIAAVLPEAPTDVAAVAPTESPVPPAVPPEVTRAVEPEAPTRVAEAPAEEAQVEETAVEETAVEETAVEETAVEETAAPAAMARVRRTRTRRTAMSAAMTPRATPPAPTPMTPSASATTPPAPWSGSAQSDEGEAPPPDEDPGFVSAAAYSSRARSTVARQHAGDIQRCFDRAIATEPTLSGTILVGLMLMENGQVAGGRVIRNTTGHDAIGSCITSAARSWRLPPPPPRAFEFRMSFSR